MQYLRQSTASQEISLGYFLDSTNGDSEETGLTINNTDIQLRKGGATTLTDKNSGGATHIANGIYSAVLDATDSDTLGMLEVYVHVAGALANKERYMVLPTASFDALVTNGLNDIAATDIVSGGAIDTTSGAVDDVTLVATTTANSDMRGTDSALLAADIDLTAGAVDTVTTVTNAVVTDRASIIGALGVEGIADAGGSTTTLVDAALTQADEFWTDSYILFTSGTNDGRLVKVTAFIASSDTITFTPTIDAAVGAADTYILIGTAYANGADPTVVQIVDGVWDELKSAHTTPNSFGDFLDIEITSRASPTDIVSGGAIDTTGGAVDSVTLTATTTDVTNDVGITQAGADKVWGTTVRILTASTNFNDIAATDIVSAGAITTLTGSVVSVDLVDTTTTNSDMVGTDDALLAASAPTNFGDMSITVTTGLVDITQTAADKVWSTAVRVLTASTNFNDISTSEVNTEVNDVLNVDTQAELGSVPAANAALGAKIGWSFMLQRNKILQTSTVQTVRNDADSGDVATASVADDGSTFTRSEFT